MTPPPAMRIVLQTGASSGINRLFAVAFTFASVLGGGMMALFVWAGDMPVPHRYLLPFAPLGFIGASIGFHVATWRTRATDLRLEREALTVLGGAASGRTVPFVQVDPERTRAEVDPTMRVTINGETTLRQKLILSLRDGSELTLGTSIDPEEQLSFAGLVAALRDAARAAADPGAEPAAEGPPTVVRCPGCGAPVTPADAALVTCWRCERAAAVPDGIRQRVRAGATLTRARAELFRGLDTVLRQPSAESTNGWLLATLVVPYVLPLGMCLQSPWPAWIAGGMVVMELFNLQVARRAAFRHLAVVYAARPATAPGGPLRCRSCAGPLPAGGPDGDAILVACPYCEADNVRALQLERPAAVWAEAAEDLSRFLADHRRRAQGPALRAGFWALAAAISIVLQVGGYWS